MAKKTGPTKPRVMPNDRAELEKFMARIREAVSSIMAIEAKYAGKIIKLHGDIDKLKKEAQDKARPHDKLISTLAKGVYSFAETHRTELTGGKSKTFEFLTGDLLKWYMSKKSVDVADEKLAVAELKEKGFPELVRMIEEVNKEDILKTPEVVKDLKFLSIHQDEIFAIVLSNLGLELKKGERKFKKVEA